MYCPYRIYRVNSTVRVIPRDNRLLCAKLVLFYSKHACYRTNSRYSGKNIL